MVSDLQKKIERYEELIKLGQLTSSSLDIKQIQKKACTSIAKLLDCEKVLLYRKEEKLQEVVYRYQIDHNIEEVRFAIDEHSFVGACAHYLATLSIDNVKMDIRKKRESDLVKSLKPKNILLFPLVSKGELIGVVEAINSNKGGFDEEDVHFSEAIANELTTTLLNALLFEKQQRMFIQVVESLADAIGKKDAYTGGHTKRVRHFAEMIGKEMELNFNEMNDLLLASVLHDIGKIGIEDSILKKRAPLTDSEFEIMKSHPALGHEILKKIEGLENVVDGMRFHHERPDGKGYPFGLKDGEIPVIASIISVADTFDAMISTRPYRKGLPPMVAYEEILKYSGTQFDTAVVAAFERWFKKSRMYKDSTLVSQRKAS